MDVVEVDLAEVAAPRGRRAREEVVQRLETELAHPLGLLLVLRDVLDELPRESLRGLVGVAALRVMEAEALGVVGADVLEPRLLLREDLAGRRDCRGVWLRHVGPPQTVSFTSPSSTRAAKVSTGW